MNFQKFIVILILALVTMSCKTNKTVTSEKKETDNTYIGRFPDKDISKELDEISNAIKRIECLTFYETYVFPGNNSLRKDSLTGINLKKEAIASEITHTSVSGTATIIYYDEKNAGILTCAHVIDFPDTIYNWEDEQQTKLYSVAIKLRQKIYVSGLPAGSDIQIVAMDKKNDIVLLKKELKPGHEKTEIFDMKIGKPKELEWGTLVYVMGYPLGDLMLTRAIVSNPEKIKHGTILTDATYNKGISGAPVFVYRQGTTGFEWVGMAKSSAVDKFYYLRPEKDFMKPFNVDQFYTDKEFMGQYTEINYGVAYSMTIDVIIKFFRANREQIEAAGIHLGEPWN